MFLFSFSLSYYELLVYLKKKKKKKIKFHDSFLKIKNCCLIELKTIL